MLKRHSLLDFDPRPPQYRKVDEKGIDCFQSDLVSLQYPCAFLDVLVPSVSNIHHDHTYALSPGTYNETILCDNFNNDAAESDIPCFDPLSDDIKVRIKATLTVSAEHRAEIELKTRDQSSSRLHEVRSKRITGSKCGRILCQKKRAFLFYSSVCILKP